MPLLKSLPDEVLRDEAPACKKFVTAKKLLQTDATLFAPLTVQEVKSVKLRVARTCAPFAQSGLQAYKDFVRNSSVIPTGVINVDLLLDGGLSSEQVVEVFGHSGTGKSEFCHRLAANAALNLSKNVLYIQTKGDFSPQKMEGILQGSAKSVDALGCEFFSI